MTFVRLAGEEDIADVDREMVESGRAQYGGLLETWRAILRKPGLFDAYLPFLRQVAGPGGLDDVKAVTALLVGHLNNCRYTVSHRLAAARRVGVDDEIAIAAIEHRWDAFPPAWQAALEATEVLTLAPATVAYSDQPQLLDAGLRERLSEHFTDEQLVELIMSIAAWNALARFHRVMGFDLDMPVPPAELEPH